MYARAPHLQIATINANDATQWFERDLDDFLREIHRDSEEQDQAKLEEDEEKIIQYINPKQHRWKQTAKLMDDFDKWNFDTFRYFDILEESTMIHFGFKLFHTYGLLDKFSVPDGNSNSCYTLGNFVSLLH